MSVGNHPRLKVCFVVPSLAGGGAERVAVQVLNALAPERWDRSMFLFERSGRYLADVSPSIRLEAAPASAALRRLGRWTALRRFVRGARPDVIVAFLSYLSVLTAARAAGVGAKVVFAVGTPMSADRKSTRLNSSHGYISYAVFCLKKKKK